MIPRILFTLTALAPTVVLAAAPPETESSKLSAWALRLPDAQPATTPNTEFSAFRDAKGAEPARLIDQIDGLEIQARELGDGSQLVGLFNREGRKPELNISQAAFSSDVVSQKSGPVDIDIPLNGARKLYLAADEATDGNSGDHADWIEPRLTGTSGELKLTDLKWLSATTGWGNVSVGHSAGGGPLQIGDPCHGPKANTTYDSQSTHVIQVQGKKDAYIFMSDRWKPSNLRDSRYVWLPLRFEGDQPIIDWKDSWSPQDL